MTEPTEFDENKIVGDYAKSKTVATRLVFDYIRARAPRGGRLSVGDCRAERL